MLVRLQNADVAVDIAQFALFSVSGTDGWYLSGLLLSSQTWVTVATYTNEKEAIADLDLLWRTSEQLHREHI